MTGSPSRDCEPGFLLDFTPHRRSGVGARGVLAGRAAPLDAVLELTVDDEPRSSGGSSSGPRSRVAPTTPRMSSASGWRSITPRPPSGGDVCRARAARAGRRARRRGRGERAKAHRRSSCASTDHGRRKAGVPVFARERIQWIKTPTRSARCGGWPRRRRVPRHAARGDRPGADHPPNSTHRGPSSATTAAAVVRRGAGLPAYACTSVNDEIVHGIPGERMPRGRPPRSTVVRSCDGWHGDAAISRIVGGREVGRPRGTHGCHRRIALAASVRRGRSRVAPTTRHRGTAPPRRESGRRTHGIVEDYVGHGIGRRCTWSPTSPTIGSAGRGPTVKNASTLAIEPMVTLGSRTTARSRRRRDGRHAGRLPRLRTGEQHRAAHPVDSGAHRDGQAPRAWREVRTLDVTARCSSAGAPGCYHWFMTIHGWPRWATSEPVRRQTRRPGADEAGGWQPRGCRRRRWGPPRRRVCRGEGSHGTRVDGNGIRRRPRGDLDGRRAGLWRARIGRWTDGDGVDHDSGMAGVPAPGGTFDRHPVRRRRRSRSGVRVTPGRHLGRPSG